MVFSQGAKYRGGGGGGGVTKKKKGKVVQRGKHTSDNGPRRGNPETDATFEQSQERPPLERDNWTESKGKL